jgi:hypothetical protein
MESIFGIKEEVSVPRQTQPYTSFKNLGGTSVSQEEVEAEVARWPLDGLLGCLAMLSLDAVQKGQDFFDARHQGPYLNLAIVDDFPSLLQDASKMYAPGRVPITGGRHIFIHELNMARLAHIAMFNGKEGSVTAEIGYDLSRRACRLLLILNDLSPGGDIQIETIRNSLVERRKFSLEWLRYHQFNRFFNSVYASMAKLARQRILLLQILPDFFRDTERAFYEATGGVSLKRYFEILAVLLSHVYYQMKPTKHWIRKQEFTAQLKAGSADIDLIMRRWTRTPQEYRGAFTEWTSSRPQSGAPGFDFVPLREAPLIEARPDELVCPVLPFLLAKIEDDPYFILSDYLDNPQELQRAIGLAYQVYAARLVERISKSDSAGVWNYQSCPTVRENVELADDYLQKGDIGVCFEHKGGRPGTDFLRGGGGDQVLGPHDEILDRLDRREPVNCKEGRDRDNGVLTRGMWQQSLHGPELVSWAERKMGNTPREIWPILTHFCNLLIDEVVDPLYMDPLIEVGQLYHDNFWRKPQWLHIGDLEALATLAEQGSLDLAALLSRKSAKYKYARFDVFLHEQFRGKRTIDSALMDEAVTLLKEVEITFWTEDVELEKTR